MSVAIDAVRITVTKEIAATIKTAVGVVPKRSRLAVLGMVTITVEPRTVAFTTTDLEVWYTGTVESVDTYGHRFTVLVPVGALKGVKRGSEIALSADSVTVDGIAYKCGIDPAEYPILPELGMRSRIPLSAGYFADLQHCAVSASDSELRPVLTGVHHTTEYIAATDGSRLLFAPQAMGFSPSFVLPASAARLVAKTFPNGGRVQISARYAAYMDARTTIVSQLLEGSYPDVRRIIPGEGRTRVGIEDPKSWIPAVKAAAAIVKKANNELMRMNVERGGEITITAEHGGASFETTLIAAVRGEGLTIGVNARHLLDALQQMEGETAIAFSGRNYPLKMTCSGSQRMAVVSPIMLR